MPQPSVPPFPTDSGEDPVGVEPLAARLAEGLGEADRSAAQSQLATVLSALVEEADGSPSSPDDLRTAYEDIAERLGAVTVDERPALIERETLRVRIQQLLSLSLVLAIRRHLLENPAAAPAAEPWLGSLGANWDDADRDEVEEAAVRLLEERNSLEERVQAEAAEVAETHRIELLHTRLNLEAARTGSFATAAGMLRDYLADAGEPPQELDIH